MDRESQFEVLFPAGLRDFRTTHWSLVLAAADWHSPRSEQALATLCQAYWHPVYAFIRRRGYDPDQAKDLTQQLFERLLEKHDLEGADRAKGRFRTFLLSCAQHFLSNERKKQEAAKRGGQFTFVSLNDTEAEGQYLGEAVDSETPETLFERQWATTLVYQTLEALKKEYEEAGREYEFALLQVFLSGSKDAPTSYAELAGRLRMSEPAVRQAAHRMRCRYRDLLRWEVAQTVLDASEVEDELTHLRRVLSS